MAKKKFEAHFSPKVLTTPAGRLVFPALNEPSSYQGGKPYYQGTLVIPNKSDMTAILKAVEDVGLQTFGKEWLTDKSFNRPIVTGEQHLEDHETAPGSLYAGTYVLKASSSTESQKGKPLAPPDCYTADKAKMQRRPGVAEDGKVIEEMFYPGCICRFAVTACSYQTGKVAGVKLLLKGIQFVKDHDRLGGASLDEVWNDAVDDQFGESSFVDDEDEAEEGVNI